MRNEIANFFLSRSMYTCISSIFIAIMNTFHKLYDLVMKKNVIENFLYGCT